MSFSASWTIVVWLNWPLGLRRGPTYDEVVDRQRARRSRAN